MLAQPRTFGQKCLGDEMKDRFIKTLVPHYSIQYCIWPATLMRAVTAAYTETGHFEAGKIAVSNIDVYSNHGKTLRHKGQRYRTYISSPYTRVAVE